MKPAPRRANLRNKRQTIAHLLALSLAGLLCFAVGGRTLTAAANSNHAGLHWVGTWMAAPAEGGAKAPSIDNQTLREIVHATIGGDSVRVRISNTFGKQPLPIGAAHIALRGSESGIAGGTDRPLTFSGRSSISIPAGALVLSDPVKLAVPADRDLAVSLFFPLPTPEDTVHPLALQTCYVSGPGDFTAAASIPSATKIETWPFLTGVDVIASQKTSAIVAFGDSITDGYDSTPDTNRRWPNFLAGRLLQKSKGKAPAVLNAGISGNRVLHDSGGAGRSALERFDRDVIAQPGVKYVIVLEGINDIGGSNREPVTAADIIAGLQQLADRAHEHGLRIFAGTLTPFEGTEYPGYYSPEKDKMREAVNDWIRTSNAFDAVFEFEKAVLDPKQPGRILPVMSGPDNLHPNDAGYKAMAGVIDLSLFR
jgi:lysophospholipase L1-like esterase